MTRVRDSLRFTLADGTYKKTHAGLGEQVASSYIAGLTARPYWDARGGDFPWMEHLERNHETIRDELRAALADPLLQQKGNAIWVAAARDDAEGYGPDWRTLVLQDRCEWEPTNVTLFPETVALVRAARAPSVEVFFAKQAPGTGIKPHTDFTNFIMTAHLGLDVPPKPESWMKVGEETRYWENGVGMCADTSFIHSTSNDSAEKDRYVLIVRFWHPELTSHERNGVRFLFDAFEDLTPEGLRRARAHLETALLSPIRGAGGLQEPLDLSELADELDLCRRARGARARRPQPARAVLQPATARVTADAPSSVASAGEGLLSVLQGEKRPAE